MMTATTVSSVNAAEILRRAQDLAPVLRSRAEDIERARRMPPDVVELLRATGVFRMGFSRDRGGPELSSIEQTEVIEALAYGDPSAGWCAMIGSDTGLYAAFLDRDVADRMFPTLDLVTAGLLFPNGRADVEPGGYRLNGRWQFGSGITHADWVISGAFRYRDGNPEPGPGGVGHGSVLLMVPRSEVEVLDTWHTTGLAGSGSLDYKMDDVFVPEEHSFNFGVARSRTGPMSAPDTLMRKMPAVPLGAARAALDYVRDMARTRTNRQTGEPWSDNYRVQFVLGECEMEYITLRHAVYGSVEHRWERLSAGVAFADLEPEELVETTLVALKAFRGSLAIVRRLYDLLQTTSIYRPSPMDRWLRDLNTMCQHVMAQDVIIQTAGAHLVGGVPRFPFALGVAQH
jgi:alkylation response protein AidB-like acyl-CoA dehydrogenase